MAKRIYITCGVIALIIAAGLSVIIFTPQPKVGDFWQGNPPDNPFEENNRTIYKVIDVKDGYVLYEYPSEWNAVGISRSSTTIEWFVLDSRKIEDVNNWK